MKYDYSRVVDLDYEKAIEKVTEELKKEGFGVLTEIDVKSTLKMKLDVDVRPYKILGACNPTLAHQAIQEEENIGLLLPCNVTVYRNKNDETVVSAIEPDAMFTVVDNENVKGVAEQVKEKLHRAIDSV
ncbi:MAG: DUF302 domain-containing protein [bacterium]|nr:DUF302 domain-containing protein [bacterium]